MKNITQLFCLLIILVLANSCSFIYYPTYPVVPDAKDKGFGIQGTLGLTKAQLSAWYALDSNWYFTGTAAGAISILGDADGDTTTTRPLNVKAFTVGAGYNVKLNKKADFNIQAGVGMSQGYFRTDAFKPLNSSSFYGDLVNTQTTRYYVQPSFRTGNSKDGFYIIPRVTYETFTYIKPKYGNDQYIKRNFLITEIFLMGRFDLKAVNLDIYMGFAGNVTSGSNDFEQVWIAQPIVLGFGVSKTIGQ